MCEGLVFLVKFILPYNDLLLKYIQNSYHYFEKKISFTIKNINNQINKNKMKKLFTILASLLITVSVFGQNAAINTSRSNIKHPNIKVENGSNEKDMQIPKIANGLNSQVVSITVKGNGATTANGIPIVEGRMVSGNIKMMKGLSNAGVSILIEQKESGDKASAVTDEKGNFLMVLTIDTAHVVSVNGAEYGKIKIVSSNAFPKELSGKVKSIDVKTKSYIIIIDNKEYTAHYTELPPVIGSTEQYSESSAAQLAGGRSSCERCVEMCPGVCFFNSSGYCRCYMKILK